MAYNKARWLFFEKSGGKDFTISVIAPASFLQDSKAVLQIDFSASPKENNSAPILDIMLATVNDRLPSGESIQLMHQTFSRDWGPLPSIQNLQRRALDYIPPEGNVSVQLPDDPEERIKRQFSNLHLSYSGFEKRQVNEDTLVATKPFPIKSLSEGDHYLVVDVILKKQDKENELGIYALVAELQQWSNGQTPTILWKEMHLNNRDTLPQLTHLYSRASETFSKLTRKERNKQDELPQHNTSFQLPEATKKIMDALRNNQVNGKQQRPKM